MTVFRAAGGAGRISTVAVPGRRWRCSAVVWENEVAASLAALRSGQFDTKIQSFTLLGNMFRVALDVRLRTRGGMAGAIAAALH
ncbi:hypothetical protein [Rhodococcus sp. BS-15]|uniref:hypothetical protein n=1 Tax=Rhodococcus sp. BS-15 TaxID=1304954 RepID=UPI000FFBF6D1|nr:hypothetical protein [Rhodococcus sp. BS-15]